MDVELVIGRVGTHTGHLKDNREILGINEDGQEVPLETLLDQDALETLIGKPIRLNHETDVGVVREVLISRDIPYAIGVVTDQSAIEILERSKSLGKTLETSPRFSAQLRLDSHGRVEQHSRVYEEISILTPDIAGRGGKSVFAKYQKEGTVMEEKLSALEAKLDMIIQKMMEHGEEMESEDMESEDCVQAEYKKGYEAGKLDAQYSLKVESLAKRSGLTLKSEDLEGQMTEVLEAIGIKAQDSSYARAAIDTASALQISGKRVAENKADAHKADAPAQQQMKRTVSVKLQ